MCTATQPETIRRSAAIWPPAFWLCVFAVPALSAFAVSARGADRYAELRRQMVNEVVIAAGVKNPSVIKSVASVPRHEFVPIGDRDKAYLDMALPIGEGQTISPPFVVASMTEHLDPQPTDVVLEIGTGSGYQAAILSGVVKDVYSIEIQRPLGIRAAKTLSRLGYKNIHTKIGDGYQGWAEHAPFDKIIVTCSPEKIPQPLKDQLREGGRMIVPVGERFNQTLYLFKKVDGKLEKEAIEGTMFVPMTGTAEQLREIEYDSTKPALLNGGFEASTIVKGVPDGWYYFRQGALTAGDDAPEGRTYLAFKNETPGLLAQALQAFGIDGRKIRELDVRLWIKADNVRPSPMNPRQMPRLIVYYYDLSRAQVGEQYIGPWSGTFDWTEKKYRISVPDNARMAVLCIGMLGATGEFSFDDVELKPVAK